MFGLITDGIIWLQMALYKIKWLEVLILSLRYKNTSYFCWRIVYFELCCDAKNNMCVAQDSQMNEFIICACT